MKIDIGDLCTHCGMETSFGTSLFVNRIPSRTNGTLELKLTYGWPLDVEVEGYMCPACQQLECDK